MTFRDYVIESNSFYKKAKRFVKDKISAQEYTFIAPILKGVKPVETEKAYDLYVDWDEAVAYNTNKSMKFLSVLPSQELFVKEQIKKFKDKIEFEIEDNVTFYKFVVGIGYKEDINDFVKEKLKGAEVLISKYIW